MNLGHQATPPGSLLEARAIEQEALRRYGHPVTDIEAIEFQAVKDQVRAEISEPPAVDPLYWEDCCDYTYAAASIARGGGIWPSMVSVEWPEEGTYAAHDLRSLAAMLIRAADRCDESTREVFGE